MKQQQKQEPKRSFFESIKHQLATRWGYVPKIKMGDEPKPGAQLYDYRCDVQTTAGMRKVFVRAYNETEAGNKAKVELMGRITCKTYRLSKVA